MWWILLALGAESCQTWTCAELSDPSICLTWTGEAVTVNTVGCASYQEECTYSLAADAISKLSSGSYACEATAPQTATSQFFASCGKREPQQRRLKAGSFPKECEETSEDACELQDGTTLPCQCGLDGKKYCRPNPSDVPFDDFWKACEDENFVVRQDFFDFYKLKHQLYVELMSAPDCVPKLIYEFSKLVSVAPEYSAAAAICIAMISSLA